MTYLKEDTQHSKAIRVAGRVTTAAVLAAVPVHQVELQPTQQESITHSKSDQTRFQSNNAVFWDVTPCAACKNRRFGGT
jgi:hypothetical protein